MVRLLLRVGRERPHAQRRVRLADGARSADRAAVKVERLGAGDAVGEEPRERIREPEVRRHLRAVVRAAEHPDLRARIARRVGLAPP